MCLRVWDLRDWGLSHFGFSYLLANRLLVSSADPFAAEHRLCKLLVNDKHLTASASNLQDPFLSECQEHIPCFASELEEEVAQLEEEARR